MTDCPLEQLDSGKWYCPVCDPDKRRLLPVKARRNCPGHPVTRPERIHPEPVNLENLAHAAERLGIKPEHVSHYATALARWTAAGFPTRTQAEVDACLAVCQTCEHYTGGRCRKCGCCVNKSKMAVLNKAKMATEACPEGKWPANIPA